jgi:hypothetical protein
MRPSFGTGPVVEAIHIAAAKRAPMNSVGSVVAETGIGFVGDRYFVHSRRTADE